MKVTSAIIARTYPSPMSVRHPDAHAPAMMAPMPNTKAPIIMGSPTGAMFALPISASFLSIGRRPAACAHCQDSVNRVVTVNMVISAVLRLPSPTTYTRLMPPAKPKAPRTST